MYIDDAVAVQETVATQDPTVMWVTAGFMALIGLGILFFGYRLNRWAAKINAALMLGGFAFALLGGADTIILSLPAALLFGFLGYKLGDVYYFVNVALYGLFAGGVLGYLVSLAVLPDSGLLLAIGGAVAGAVLGVIFERPIGIFATSVIGSAFIVLTVPIIRGKGSVDVENGELPEISMLVGGLFVLTTLIGCVVQAKSTKNLPSRKEEQARKESAPSA